jgi:putative sulfotransferase
MSTPTFVVGTGRCGSTMLSNMLREHPKVLSLSEFFSIVTNAGRLPGAFAPEPISGRDFWTMITLPHPRNNFAMRQGIAAPELLYPANDSAFRFSAELGIPSIVIATLPHLTGDPDHLYGLLDEDVVSWPIAPIADHYRRLFDWLSGHFRKNLWAERSGSSLMLIEQMQLMFPDARFVHVVRDGRDSCLSMHAHFGFRIGYVMAVLEQYLGVDPLLSADRTRIDAVPEELRAFLPEEFDAAAFRTYSVPLSTLGLLWSQQIAAGLKLLNSLGASRLLTLRYDDILADPKRQLDILAAFLGEDYVDQDWSTRCAATVRPPRSTWRDLPEEEVRALTEACRPGFELLAAAGVDYDV